ncbi:MAG: DUF349 domain-containing protein, partial [Comamonadaceae bacterium]
QRWSADKVREDLVAKAEGLLKRPEGQALGGRKMQETLRRLREEWKQTDQGGPSNHGLWKRFDEACNEAHKVVEAWLEKNRAEAATHKAHRLALVDEVRQWTAAHAASTDWRGMQRALHQFAERWRAAGHLSEKAFADLQPQWKEVISAAHVPLETAQKASVARRQALIDEAVALGAQPMLRIDAVKALQQRWQAEAQTVPLDRKHEQKLWDAFRKPIDEAFNRKTAERERATTELSARDRAVLDASKALEAANATGDAQRIRSAMADLESALRSQAQGDGAATSENIKPKTAPAPVNQAQDAMKNVADDASDGEQSAEAEASAPAPAAAPKVAPRPVVAVRGDDRPGMKKDVQPAAGGRGGRPDSRSKDGARGPRDAGRAGGDRFGSDRGGRFGDRGDAQESRGPRLGDTAFRAQRDAIEHAQSALRKLAAQAHGEALTQVLSAWSQRDPALLPSAQDLGGQVNAATRTAWAQALSSTATGDASQSLLRLEMAAEVPTPAEQLSERR